MSVEFVLSAHAKDQFPRDGLPEVAFVGRSNVGKSSLLNALLLRGKKQGSSSDLGPRNLAKTSRTPGRTRALNFFRIDERFYFVDLPGYGFAKVSRSEAAQWKQLAEDYLTGRDALRLVVLIIDSRHGPSALDQQMKDWLLVEGRRFMVVASKVDKLKQSERHRSFRSIEREFYPALPFSSQTGEGVTALWDGILLSLEQ